MPKSGAQVVAAVAGSAAADNRRQRAQRSRSRCCVADKFSSTRSTCLFEHKAAALIEAGQPVFNDAAFDVLGRHSQRQRSQQRIWCASSSTVDAHLSVSPDSVDLSTY